MNPKRKYNGIERRIVIRHALNDAIRDREGMVDAYSNMPNASQEPVVIEAQRDADAYREMLKIEYGTKPDGDLLRKVAGKRISLQEMLDKPPQKFKARKPLLKGE